LIIVPMFGGVGNQLFHIARALQHMQAGSQVILVDCARYAPLLSRVLGWTSQKDWLGTHTLCAKLNLDVRSATPFDLCMLALHKIAKPVSGTFDRPFAAVHNHAGYDVGYFQSVTKVGCDTMRTLARILASHLDIRFQGHSAIHYRASDFSATDWIPIEVFDTFAQGEKVFLVSDVNVSSLQNGRYQHFDSGSTLGDFRFIAASGKLLISRSTFGLWAALIAKELGPAQINVHHFKDWDEYLKCYTC
jgi:hypothetical protein